MDEFSLLPLNVLDIFSKALGGSAETETYDEVWIPLSRRDGLKQSLLNSFF